MMCQIVAAFLLASRMIWETLSALHHIAQLYRCHLYLIGFHDLVGTLVATAHGIGLPVTAVRSVCDLTAKRDFTKMDCSLASRKRVLAGSDLLLAYNNTVFVVGNLVFTVSEIVDGVE